MQTDAKLSEKFKCIATQIGNDKVQMRNVCSSLSDLREITRANLKASWSLIAANQPTQAYSQHSQLAEVKLRDLIEFRLKGDGQ